MINSAGRRLAFAALALSLCGCISLWPKTQPAQLYTFGAGPGAPAAAEPARFTVLEQNLDFDSLAGTDQILTVTGNEVAFIKGARWGSPAPVLFQAAIERGFDSAGGPARLVGRGGYSRADEVLKLDVLRFEARYDQGAGAPPTIVVRLRASLNKDSDRGLIGDKVFDASVTASDNRVGAITQAFDQATSKVVGDLVTWVGQSGGA